MARRRRISRPRRGRTIRVSKRMVGRSNTPADKRRKALKPGLRRASSGKRYFENRRNRSDRNPKKGL